jgi:hypothetical protein
MPPQLNPELTYKNRATIAQVNYITDLLNEVGLSDRSRAMAHLKEISKRKDLKYIDELTKFEASVCIGVLKEWRDNGKMDGDE